MFENPIWIVSIGLAATVLTLCIAAATGYRLVAWIALGIAMLTFTLLGVERAIVTPREEISRLLHEIAKDLETNEAKNIVRHIASDRVELIAHARRLIPQYRIHQAKVKGNLTVEFAPPESPQRAVARFNAVFRISETRGTVKNLISPWYFIVEFVREQGTWKAISYERRDPREGLRSGNR